MHRIPSATPPVRGAAPAPTAALLAAAAMLAGACGGPPSAAPETAGEEPAGRHLAGAGEPGSQEPAMGIDVSHHQGEVDWGAVASDGVHFVYLKATEGVDYVDPRFFDHWRAARDAGLTVGAYHLFRPEDPAGDQVDNFVSALERAGFDAGDLPPVLDIEAVSSLDRVSPEELHERSVEMLSEIHVRLGARPVVYTNPSFWRDYLSAEHALTGYPLWIAEYDRDAEAPDTPPGWSDWTLWQFTEDATVDGIGKPVDRSRFRASLAELEAFVRASRGP